MVDQPGLWMLDPELYRMGIVVVGCYDIACPYVSVLAEATGASTFPLGVASAGLTILSFLPEKPIERYMESHDLASGHGSEHGRELLMQRIAETRERGWAVNPGLIVEGSWGMGAAVFDTAGQPAWALSLTGIESRFAPERRDEMGRLLMHHAHELTKKLRGEQALPAR
ncbi:IclR family transcriptional regulator domain-containing protein [Paeniglutamicibacter gangotriensis]|nr:IclR family transcriptional regulator C-terminal domain-containing protein [Paeniglutamicibacter gangotriensis]